jgi:filamentous hemagglutinin family protein
MRHNAIVLAMACLVPMGAQANPVGGVAIHGSIAVSNPQPNTLLVTTQNGAGTSHSAVNWQSFSIPAGSTTRIEQPSAASMSINRVVTNTPSQLFGTLSSNGKVVLVNQAGIAVGAGALVDTAGFTASAVGMTDADAMNGRLRFSGDGLGTASGTLTVQGNIIARGGDVVLIAPSIELAQTAVVESQGGSVVLAAGQSVEVTGRGLEGITLQVQAPADQAVNLGTLKGDAVGIFAGTLRHSGLIQAVTASMEGGRVVLKAVGDAYVEGNARIEASGTTGGQVDVLGQRVAVTDQAVIDASGQSGGGTIRVGGDYQGKNADVPNAQVAYLGNDALLKANAIDRGNGGKVIVWADDATRAFGSIEAKGGAVSGDGGFVETSGKAYLDFQAKVDTRSPNGLTGRLLLDPTNIYIAADQATATNAGMVGTSLVTETFNPSPPAPLANRVFDATGGSTPNDSLLTVGALQTALGANNVEVTTASSRGGVGFIKVESNVSWTSASSLKLIANDQITLNATISGSNADIGLKGSSITQTATGAITAAKLEFDSVGAVGLDAASNAVGTIAGKISGAGRAFSYKNGNTNLIIGSVGVLSGTATSGITTSGGNATIDAGTGALSINNAIAVETGSVALTASSISQSGVSTNNILASSLTATVTQNATFQNDSNDVGTFSATKSGNTDPISYWDANALTLGPITATGALTIKTNGGAITQSGAISANNGGVEVTFNSGAGNITLTNASNDFSNLVISSAGVVNIKDANALTVKSFGTNPTSFNVHSVGNLTLAGALNLIATATGDAMVLRTDATLINNTASLSVPTGARWLIYLKDPGGHGFPATPAFKQYNAAYGNIVLGTGNGVLYNNTTPAVLTLAGGADALTGGVSKVYDGGLSISTANATYGTISADGLIDGDSISNPNSVSGGTGLLSDASVGTGKSVTVNNVTVGTITGGNLITTVYGYRIKGNVGVVTVAPSNPTSAQASADAVLAFADKLDAVLQEPLDVLEKKDERAKDAVVVEAEICRP